MKILHISSYYSRSKLYKKLFEKIKEFGHHQHIYTAIRTPLDINKNYIEDNQYFSFNYALLLKPFHRVFYKLKINKVFKDLENRVDCSKINVCHAHTVFSDGGVAYKIYKKYKTPYVVAVRNTDINTFFRHFYHLRAFGLAVLMNAKKIIALSEDYKQYLLKYVPKKNRKEIEAKIVVVPNGIDQFWFENPGKIKTLPISNELTFLYVGSYMKNKNVPLIIKSLREFAKQNNKYIINLNLVGGGGRAGRGAEDPQVAIEIENSKSISNLKVVEWGKITDKEELRKKYESATIFMMPSRKEGFGLVYAEAMSQGTPVIYTKGQGISSYFKQAEVGWAINEFSVEAISKGVEKILINYEDMSKNCLDNSKQFSWSIISKQYNNIYKA